MSSCSFIYFTTLFLIVNGENSLPSYIKPCHMKKNFTICVKKQIETSLPFFTQGIPELGVPSIDPVYLDDIIIDTPSLKLAFSEAKMYGLSSSKLTNFTVDIEEQKFSLSFKADMSLDAKYNVDGRILILPIKGNGDSQIKVHNVNVLIKSKLIDVNDSNGDHFKLVLPNYSYDIQNTLFSFQNLFNGNKQLSDATHQFANENWKQLMDDLAPPAIKQIVRTCVKAINKFFSKVTIKQMIEGYYKV